MAPTYATDYAIGQQGATLDEMQWAAIEVGVIAREELERWRLDLERADANGEFFLSLDQVMVAGRKQPD